MENSNQKRNNRLTIIGFLLLFTLPVILAWTAYFSGWFTDISTTNKGEWVYPIIDMNKLSPSYANQDALELQQGGKWRLLVPGAVSQCQNEETDKDCLLSLFEIGQAHKAMGKEIERIERVLYNADSAYTEAELSSLKERFVDLRVINGSKAPGLDPSYIYLMDPLGNIILKYPAVSNQEEAFLKGRDIVKDLKKLLKLSRIG